MEKLYGPMDDTPYYYCTQAILKLMEGDKEAAQEQLLSAAYARMWDAYTHRTEKKESLA